MICAVIPTLNSASALGPLLDQLGRGAARIVITDGGSDDETLRIAAKAGAITALGMPGRGTQLRRGVSWAGSCEWLLILHSDSRLPDDWQERLGTHMQNHSGKAGYFDLRFDSPKAAARILEFLVRIRCRIFGLPYGDQGLFISRALYKAIGGYTDVPLFEDVAIIRTLGKARLRRLGAPLITNACKFERDGFYRRGWRNFRLLRRYLKGETPEALLKAYM